MSISGGKTSDASIFMQWDPNSSNGGGGNGNVTNPLNANLDAGGFQIINTTNLLEIPIDQDLNMNNKNITHLAELRFNDATKITESGDTLYFVDSASQNRKIILENDRASLYETDFNNNDIVNVGSAHALNYVVAPNGSIQFPNSRSIHLYSNNTDLAIGSTNDIILTSANISNYVVNHENVDTIVFNDQTLTNTTKTLSLNSNKLYLNNDVIATISESDSLLGVQNIVLAGGDGVVSGTSDHMTYNNHVVIDEINIDTYVEQVQIPNLLKVYFVDSGPSLINPNENTTTPVYDMPIDFSELITDTYTVGYSAVIFGRVTCLCLNTNGDGTKSIVGTNSYIFHLAGYRNINNTVNPNFIIQNHSVTTENTVDDGDIIEIGDAHNGDEFNISFSYQIQLAYKIKVEYSLNYVVY